MAEGIVQGNDGRRRCYWAANDEIYRNYHDAEWGRPVHDDVRLFEKICLEGFQAGLSWLTILKKRENFRSAFSNFEFEKVARFDRRAVEALMQDTGIVRNRAKIEATIENAKAALKLVDERGGLSDYFWDFVPPRKERPRRLTKSALMKLNQTPTSAALSKDLKARGFRFVGPTTCYAFMQAMGLVDDHIEGCWVKSGARHSTTA